MVAHEGFYENDRSRVGVPGSPFESWRAEIMPDDLEVGRLLARTLLERARAEDRRGEDGRIRVLTLSGPFTQAATNRLTGFREVVVMVRDALEGHRPPRRRHVDSSMVAATLRKIDFADRFSRTDGRYDFSLTRLLD